MRKLVALLLLMLVAGYTQAQTKTAEIKGFAGSSPGTPLPQVLVQVTGSNTSVYSNNEGNFSLIVPAGKSVTLNISANGFASQFLKLTLAANDVKNITIILQPAGRTLETVVIADERQRNEVGLVRIDAQNAVTLPSTTGGVEALIKTLVGSNNELSSQYSVRGGNYDENLVYINDFEIFRPYLVSSGQQEGLSFINPELTKNVNFYNGGFQSKYGDKMSSVLDIQYKKPVRFAGSAYVSLLEQGVHAEGISKNKKATYVAGVRNKSNRNLLSNQPTQGSYLPAASDAQALLTLALRPRLQLELLGIYSTSKFTFLPESVQKTSSVFSPLFTANLGLDINFEGQEKDAYTTAMLCATIIQNINSSLRLRWLLSTFTDDEKENFDITGAYLFGDRDFDNSSATFGQIVNPLGAGVYQNYGRNSLHIQVISAAHKGNYSRGNHYLQWGTQFDQTNINDKLAQFEYRDSAGYTLPNNPGPLQLYNVQNSTADLSIQKSSAYVQDNIHLLRGRNDVSMQLGVRGNYNSLSREFLISPRAQLSWKPLGSNNIVYKLAAGVYNQPPFYREYRRYDGSLNTDIRSQKSVQFVGGADYSFFNKNKSPFRLTVEAYYKKMHDVIPYDADNVKIRYLGANNAKAYSAGIEFRLFGQLIKDAQSWLSVGLMRSREDIENDFYYRYTNAAGEIIGSNTTDQVISDSLKTDIGWIRRPTDRLITVGLFLEDYLATNKNFKAHLNLLYGSNMTYNIPNSTRFRNGLIIDPYIRADVGFSALLLNEQSTRRSHNPFRGFENIWLSLEVFNLINRANTISYQLIKDFSNTTYAIPNRLTPRLLNVKLLARF